MIRRVAWFRPSFLVLLPRASDPEFNLANVLLVSSPVPFLFRLIDGDGVTEG
jgi:hypothetical protein